MGLWTVEDLKRDAQNAGLAVPVQAYRTILDAMLRTLQFRLAELLQAHYAVPAPTPPPTPPAESPSFLDRLHGRSWQPAAYRQSRFSLPAVFCQICGTYITEHPGPHDVDRGFAALLRVAIYTDWEWVCVRCFEQYQPQAGWSTAPREDPLEIPPLPGFPFTPETLTTIAGHLGLPLSREQAEGFLQQQMPRLLRPIDIASFFLLKGAAKRPPPSP